MSDNKRLNFLMEKLGIRKDTTDELAGLREALDKQGIARKERNKMLETVNKGMIDDIRNGMREIIATISDDIADDKLNSVTNDAVATIMGALMQEGTDVPEEVDVEVETMMDDDEDEVIEEESMMSNEEYAKELRGILKEQNDVLAVLKEREGQHEDLFEIAKEAVSSAKMVQELETRIVAMEKQISLRPQRASQSDETEVNPESEIAKTIGSRKDRESLAQSPIFKGMVEQS